MIRGACFFILLNIRQSYFHNTKYNNKNIVTRETKNIYIKYFFIILFADHEVKAQLSRFIMWFCFPHNKGRSYLTSETPFTVMAVLMDFLVQDKWKRRCRVNLTEFLYCEGSSTTNAKKTRENQILLLLSYILVIML